MLRAPSRLQLTAIAAVAAVLAFVLARANVVLGAGVAAVIAVGCITEAWNRRS